jgi:hypothetical protein
MRRDMAKVVTERPRRGHGNRSKKWGRRLGKNEYAAEDHGPTRAPIARHHQYGWNAKEFSDLLGPLRRYLRKQVGRPWDKVWSEIAHTLDSRSLTGQHIIHHIWWEVEQHAWLGVDGRVYRRSWSGPRRVTGLYVHPVTRLLSYSPDRPFGVGGRAFRKAQAVLCAFGLEAATATDVRCYRVDGVRAWERRDCGWFIHTYRYVPEKLVRVITGSDGRDVPIYGPSRYERVATKQASKNEVRQARRILDRDPLAGEE